MTQRQVETMDKVKAAMVPVLMAIVGWLGVQIYSDVKEVKANMITYNALLMEINERTKNNSIRILENSISIDRLEQRNIDRDAWIRDWQEKWQAALDWDNAQKKTK